MHSVYPVILAGGKGERFWPYSHSGCPKQMLPLTEERSMMEVSVDLARQLAGGNPIHLVIGSNLEAAVRQVFDAHPDVIIVAEPEGRDTCAAVALSAQLIRQINPLGVMTILTADHKISPKDAFIQTVQKAIEVASKGNSLVTLGIKPDRPETGFGYIQVKSKGMAMINTPYEVDRFVEKPDYKTAQDYLQAGNYLWNSGMFVWRADYVWSRLQESQPEMVELFEKAGPIPTSKSTEFLAQFYSQLPKTSIDYGLMEKAPKIHCIPVGFSWDDLGSWTALDRIHPLDDDSNLTVKDTAAFECYNTTVFSTGKPVIAWGLEDMLIAEVDGVTLVCPKDKIPDLKNLLGQMRSAGLDHLL